MMQDSKRRLVPPVLLAFSSNIDIQICVGSDMLFSSLAPPSEFLGSTGVSSKIERVNLHHHHL
jgi:hypothetical protein